MTGEERGQMLDMVRAFLDRHADAPLIVMRTVLGFDGEKDWDSGSVLRSPNSTATLTIRVNGGAGEIQT